jgi:hypothetical protein
LRAAPAAPSSPRPRRRQSGLARLHDGLSGRPMATRRPPPSSGLRSNA